jgi:uncharacterized protein (TIGR03067 family)
MVLQDQTPPLKTLLPLDRRIPMPIHRILSLLDFGIVAASILLASPALSSAQAQPDRTTGVDVKAPAKAKAAAAHKAYDAYFASFKAGNQDAESVYRWSRRRMEAERELATKEGNAVAAVETHLARMKDLRGLIAKRYAGLPAAIDKQQWEGEFFVAEAEIWFDRAKQDKSRPTNSTHEKAELVERLLQAQAAVRQNVERALIVQRKLEETRRNARPGDASGGANAPAGRQGRVTNAKDLADAIEQCRKRLEQDGRGEYAALLTEKHVKDALRQAVADYEAWLERKPGPPAGDPKYFGSVVKPVAVRIANEGVWPKECALFWFPDVLEGHAKAKEGFHLRLQIDTPGKQYEGFAFPLVDVSLGRWYLPALVVVKRDQEKLLGKWRVVKVEDDGKVQPIVPAEVVIVRDKITIPPLKWEIFLTSTSGIDHEARRIVSASQSIHHRSGILHSTYKAVLLRGGEDSKDDTAKKERDTFQGAWKVVSVEGASEEAIKDGSFTFKGEKLITTKKDGQKVESDFKLYPAKKPKAIDIIPSEGPENEKGKTFRGIYELDRDVLKICSGGPGAERPTEFSAKSGGMFVLFVLKRK